VTYADLLASWNPNNRGSYVNAEYDRWFRVLQGSTDRRERMDAAAELQKIILDDVPLLPTAETGSAYLQHPKLKGVVRRALGQDPDYTHARVIK
jgi:ABC-type oligopeptide transport system substrate-binding subunit